MCKKACDQKKVDPGLFNPSDPVLFGPSWVVLLLFVLSILGLVQTIEVGDPLLILPAIGCVFLTTFLILGGIASGRNRQ